MKRTDLTSQIAEESRSYALASIALYQRLTERKERPEHNLSRQYLLTSTSIGSLVQEEDYTDALRKARCARYWLEMLRESGYAGKEETERLYDNVSSLIRSLTVLKKELEGIRKPLKD